MLKYFLIFFFLFYFTHQKAVAQYAQKNKQNTFVNKLRSVQYNAFGMGVLPYGHLMSGGNHVSYKKYGFGLSWRVGVKNIISKPGKEADFSYDSALFKGWLTGNTVRYFNYSVCLNFVLPITKKIPLYAGFGATRVGMYAESIEVDPFGTLKEPTWHIVKNEVKFKPTFTIGTFIPLYNMLILNVGYDYLPQTLFVGFAIGHPFNYEDIDLW